MESASRDRVYRESVVRDVKHIRSTTRGPPLSSDALRVSVLGTFQFWVADHLLPTLPGGSQRLLAFLALRERAVTRFAAAGTLWPDATESHASSSLRSALSRLESVTRHAVVATSIDVSFADDVVVDVRSSRAIAHRLIDRDGVLRPLDLSTDSIAALSTDLLPDWYDDWVVIESEDWRQLRLHALEALSSRLTDERRPGEAIQAALAVVSTEPLRESGQAALVRAHLAEGNQSEALRVYRRYATHLHHELGIEPTKGLQSLVPSLHSP